MSTRWTRPVTIVLGLIAVLWANYYLRSNLEESPRYLYSFMDRFYPTQTPIVLQLPTWKLFLPIKELTGAWAATTLILTYKLEHAITSAGTWYLYNALAIVVAFATSWALFRSAVFSFTFTLCVGFGTQFVHAYAVTGGIASYIVNVYFMLLLFTTVQLVRGARPSGVWVAAFAFSLFLNVFGYEGWLDILALVWVSTPFIYFGLRRLERPADATRLLRMAALFTAVGILYVVVKVTLGFGQVEGSESDVVFNHDNLWLVLDDLVSNVFTHVFLSISNFLPPLLVGSQSGYQLGVEHAIDAQHGYHETFLYLVAMHQVFFWRYYAGAAVALLCVAVYQTSKRQWTRPSPWTLALLVFLLMIVVPGGTHMLVKFRPMNAMPALTYHVTVGMMGAALVISWLLTSAWRSWPHRTAAVAVIVLTWSTILYGALARPPYLAYMAAQSGLGNQLYPNPMRMLIERWGGTYLPPKGMAAYPLMPYRPDDNIATARGLLADLPTPLPPIGEWERPTAQTSTPSKKGGLDFVGDTTQQGYQLVSPPVPVTAGATYLARMKFEVVEGRVCAGILTGDQQRWIVPPDGATVEFLFKPEKADAFRMIIANCYTLDGGNPPSRFRVVGGSYAMVAPATATP